VHDLQEGHKSLTASLSAQNRVITSSYTCDALGALDASRLLSGTHHAGRVAYNRAMRLVDPMGQPPVHYYPVPEKDHLPPWAMVSRSPLGWFLFLRNVELDDEIPSYGVDWDGWVGYHY